MLLFFVRSSWKFSRRSNTALLTSHNSPGMTTGFLPKLGNATWQQSKESMLRVVFVVKFKRPVTLFLG